jgi:F-type H+-transporting ATPase subunit b
MIGVDFSLIPAILIFLALIFALQQLLFKPLLRVQAEREGRTSGLMANSRQQLDYCTEMFNKYEAAVRNGRTEGYRLQEEARADAMKERAEALQQARRSAERLLEESRSSIQAEVQAAKIQLEREVYEIARGIAAIVLQRQS